VQVLWLTHDQADQISAHARAEAPREACGLIAGTDGRALDIVPVANAAADPLHHYLMDPAQMTRAMLGFERRGLGLIGIYHSHPHSDPIPSPVDVRQAAYPDTTYLIVGLKHPESQLAAWSIRAGAVERVDLHIGFEGPPELPRSLSRAQIAAIVLSAVLVVALMLALSLSLLPPAPVIVTPIR
jgi:proteasome lid subunit RPN8/RPN11